MTVTRRPLLIYELIVISENVTAEQLPRITVSERINERIAALNADMARPQFTIEGFTTITIGDDTLHTFLLARPE